MRHAGESIDTDLFRMGLDWEAIRRGEVPNMGPLRVARLLLSQAAGAEVWQDIGGWKAQPDVLTAAQQLIYVQAAIAHGQSGSTSQGPKEPQPPKGRVELREKKKREAKRFVSKAEQWKRRLDDPVRRAEIERRLASWGKDAGKNKVEGVNAEKARRLAAWKPAEVAPAPRLSLDDGGTVGE